MKDYYWLNKNSERFLSQGYLEGDETGKSRVKDIGLAAEEYLSIKGFAEKFEKYMAMGFYSLSSPEWANFGKQRGLPISCNGVYVPDTMDGILYKQAEVGMQTKHGSGTSAFFGDIRGRGSKITAGGTSSGSVHFMELFDKVTSVVSQSNVRRGSFAAYLPVDHPDIKEFLRIRSSGHSIQEMSFAVCISDEWMESMIAGDPEKREIQAKIIEKRFETGYPYLFFTGAANKNAPQVYKDKEMKIYASNLCNEIALPSSEDESFVCCLASLNLERWDDIIKTDAIETLVCFLDAVMEEYIQKTEGLPFMEASHNFAKRHRALGMGVLGWHSLLQNKNIAFESMEAKLLNAAIFQEIRKKADKATEDLAKLLGEPEVLKGYGRRNTTTLAIAPTTSSSFILGQVSPSIEPLNSNYFTKNLAKGSFTYKNPYLTELLKEKGENKPSVWKSILTHAGSVQHLEFLTEKEKDVFKTFGEISQREIVIQAAQRQKYIDQGQSLNLMIPPKASPKEVNELLILGWQSGLKGFYYHRSANPSQELARSIMNCSSCEG
jgi:ribonucleoside-diphosphate reductase alpha chain